MDKVTPILKRSGYARKIIDEKVLMALACGATPEAAAKQINVSIHTVRKRLVDPEFLRRLRSIRDDMVKRTASMLTAAAGEAVRTLLDLQSPKQPGMVRLGAARAIIELGIRTREHVEFTDRLASLEGQVFISVNGTTAIPSALMPTVVDAVPNGTFDAMANLDQRDATDANVGEPDGELRETTPT